MTVQFWTLFFEKSVNTTPIALNLILLAACLATAGGIYLARLIAVRFGGVSVCLSFMATGIGTLVAIAVLHDQGKIQGVEGQWLIACLYVLRMALMNAPTPLFRAILMDSIPSENRAKWASLSSITTIGWSGSALLGGFLCDTYGYGVTFFITGVLQTLSLVPLLFMRKE